MNKPNKLHIDLETFSSVDLRSSGVYKYAASLDFEILMLAYAIDENPVVIVDLARGEELPAEFINAFRDPDVLNLAHNALFERVCLAATGLKSDIKQWYCTAIKSAYCGLPLSLAGASSALRLYDMGKDSAGKRLIRYFCIPCKPTKTNGQRRRNFPEHDLEKWQDFKDYCVQDVIAEREIAKRLSPYKIPQFDRNLYALDQKINDRGVLISVKLAKSCLSINATNTGRLLAETKRLTGLENPNSPTQLKRWLSEKLQKEITTLAKKELQSHIDQAGSGLIRDVLTIRQKLAKTSIRKYLAMLSCIGHDERARGLFQFYGASTGRWAGRLVQLQNLPRNYVEPLADIRRLALAGDLDALDLMFEDVSNILSQLIRTALIAPKGKIFAVNDFSAIEARVIAWLAGEKWRIDVFKGDGKIYEASAAMMFGVPIESVTKASGLRAKGKVAELALGYQGGVNALKVMGAEAMGLDDQEMQDIVTKWRKASPAIKSLWAKVNSAAIKAIKEPGKTVRIPKLTFKYDGTVLRIGLPSGRKLFYQKPKIAKNRFDRDSIFYKGVDSVTRKWVYINTYGGKLVENIVQAIARDLLAEAMISLDSQGHYLVMHVHDETVTEVDIDSAEDDLAKINRIMSEPPAWAIDIPLGADGYLTPFYKKD